MILVLLVIYENFKYITKIIQLKITKFITKKNKLNKRKRKDFQKNKNKKTETTQLKMQETVINSSADSSYQKLQSHKINQKRPNFVGKKKKRNPDGIII